jgi:hypothetical protein
MLCRLQELSPLDSFLGPINPPLILRTYFSNLNNVAYRPVAKPWLCKQRPLLGNACNLHARNNRTTVLCNPFLSNGYVNTSLQQWSYCWKRCFLFDPCKVVIRKTTGAIQLVEGWKSGCGEKSWLQECGSEKKTLRVLELQWDCYNYCVKIRCQDATSEDTEGWRRLSV